MIYKSMRSNNGQRFSNIVVLDKMIWDFVQVSKAKKSDSLDRVHLIYKFSDNQFEQ